MRRPWPTSSPPTCSRRPGLPHGRPGRPAAWSAPGLRCSAWPLASSPRSTPSPPTTPWPLPPPMPSARPGGSSSRASSPPSPRWPGPGRGFRPTDRRRLRRDWRAGAGDPPPVRPVRPRRPGRRLLPIPGIGLLTAALVVAEVWGLSRFPSADKLCSWAGLTPRSAPAPSTPGGGTSPSRARGGSGGPWWRRPRPRLSPELRWSSDPIAGRRGRFFARVAVARPILTLRYYALRGRDGVPDLPGPPRRASGRAREGSRPRLLATAPLTDRAARAARSPWEPTRMDDWRRRRPPCCSRPTDHLGHPFQDGPRRRRSHSSGRALHLDPGCGPPHRVGQGLDEEERT